MKHKTALILLIQVCVLAFITGQYSMLVYQYFLRILHCILSLQ